MISITKKIFVFRFVMFNRYRIPRENLLNKTGDVTPEGNYVSPYSDPNKRFGKFSNNNNNNNFVSVCCCKFLPKLPDGWSLRVLYSRSTWLDSDVRVYFRS